MQTRKIGKLRSVWHFIYELHVLHFINTVCFSVVSTRKALYSASCIICYCVLCYKMWPLTRLKWWKVHVFSGVTDNAYSLYLKDNSSRFSLCWLFVHTFVYWKWSVYWFLYIFAYLGDSCNFWCIYTNKRCIEFQNYSLSLNDRMLHFAGCLYIYEGVHMVRVLFLIIFAFFKFWEIVELLIFYMLS